MIRRNTPVSIGIWALILIGMITAPLVTGQGGRRNQAPPDIGMSLVLGRPTDRSITLSVMAPTVLEAFVEYGITPGQYPEKTAASKGAAGEPFEIGIGKQGTLTGFGEKKRQSRRRPESVQNPVGTAPP
jgi:hypothetical protein